MEKEKGQSKNGLPLFFFLSIKTQEIRDINSPGFEQ